MHTNFYGESHECISFILFFFDKQDELYLFIERTKIGYSIYIWIWEIYYRGIDLHIWILVIIYNVHMFFYHFLQELGQY